MAVRFLHIEDYTALIRNEIKALLTTGYTDTKLFKAEDMAVSQIKNYLKGSYDINAIFAYSDGLPEPDLRSQFIVMIAIDCTLYHLYTSTAPDRIPEHRSLRYQDALNWLKEVSKGDTIADLPMLTNEEGVIKSPIRIRSKYAPSNNKW